MDFQTVFRRYEIKYLLTREQRDRILEEMAPFMEPDPYGRTTVRNLYFDTDCFRLIRRSLEKPVYKEKLRIRSYAEAREDSTVFVELKKKFEGVVYKRRLPLTERAAMGWLCGGGQSPIDTQIAREIDFVRSFYGTLKPKVFLSYEREAYYERDRGDFRVTFDERILCRQRDLSLTSAPHGTPLLPEEGVLMEVKCGGGIPLWMVRVLSREKIRKISFSKYGTAYQRLILPNEKNKSVRKGNENGNDVSGDF